MFFIHSSDDGHLVKICYHILAIVCYAELVFFSDVRSGVELLGHIVVLFLVF